jgi:apolipoprotein N-acyltransferase
VRRSRRSDPSARLWAFVMIGLNLAGATWLAIRLAVVEHDAAAGITIAMLAFAIVVGHMHAARAADSVRRRRRLVRHGKVMLPEDFGVPEMRPLDRIDPPQPKLGAPGSNN